MNRLGLEDTQISIEKALETIGREIFCQIPNDYATMVESRNNGVPLVMQAPKAKLTRTIMELAASVSGDTLAVSEDSTFEKEEKPVWVSESDKIEPEKGVFARLRHPDQDEFPVPPSHPESVWSDLHSIRNLSSRNSPLAPLPLRGPKACDHRHLGLPIFRHHRHPVTGVQSSIFYRWTYFVEPLPLSACQRSHPFFVHRQKSC